MSAQSNIDAFRRIIEEAFNCQQFAVLDELFAANYTEHQFALPANKEGMIQTINGLHRAFPDFRLTIQDIVEVDSKVWARMECQGTNLGGLMGPPNGKSYRITVFDVCRFENGKMVEHWGAPDRFAQLVQLGVIPEAATQIR